MTTSKSLSNRQIAQAALLVVLGFLASGVLGLVRTAVFAATFGASAELDAFYTAQRIPEILFTLVAGGALGSAFIPIFARHLSADEPEQAWRLASAVMTLSALAALALGLLLALAAPLYIPLLYGQGVYQGMVIRLTQIMMITPLIFSISGLLMGILNAHQRFLLPSLAISMNNIGLIVGALVFAPLLPTESGLFAYPVPVPDALALMPGAAGLLAYVTPRTANVYGLALGAVLGALLHLAVQLPGLPVVRARLRVLPDPRVPGVLAVLRLMLPRMLGLAIAQINFLVNIFFATAMFPGSLAALNTAWNLMFFVLGVVAQSVGTAVFPSLATLVAEGDMPGYKDRLAGAMRAILFLALPSTVGLIVLGQPLVAFLFERGAWTPEATEGVAWALAFFALGISGHSLLEVLSRAFYALADTLTPVLVGAASLIANIILSIVLIRVIGDPGSLARGSFAGLALANSLTTLLEGLALWWLLRRRIGALHDNVVLGNAARGLLAAVGMGVVVWWVMQALVTAPVILVVSGGVGVGALSYFALTLLLGIPEARTIPTVLLRRFRR